MSGRHITDPQVGQYMNERKDGATQIVAAAKAGISESSGRRIERGRTPVGQRPIRQYRTRTDPFQEVWRSDVVPILERAPLIRATTAPAVTVAAIDRLVHHSNIIEINTDSYRRRAAAENAAVRKCQSDQPPTTKPRTKASA